MMSNYSLRQSLHFLLGLLFKGDLDERMSLDVFAEFGRVSVFYVLE